MRKIKNFERFFESILSKKQTSGIFYSERLKSLFTKMSEQGVVLASDILAAENSNQVRDEMTLFDITEKEDSISFIQVNRLSRMRDQDPDSDKDMEISDWIRRKWYYTNSTLDFKGWTTQRTEINIGRFVTRLFQAAGKSITDKERETVVNSYKSVWKLSKDTNRFELVTGEDIRKWYLESNYQFNKGQLSNSCMRYERCQPYLDIYVENPEVCSLLILHGDDMSKIVGRALVWKAIRHGAPTTYMDRIYTNFDSDKNLFLDWSKKNDIEFSFKMDDIEVHLQKSVFDSYPYMDTFCFLNKEEKVLAGDEDLMGNENWWELHETSGGAVRGNRVWSDYEGEWIDRDDAVWCQDIGDYCYTDHARYLEYRDVWVSENNDRICYSDVDGEYYYDDDCVYSSFLQTHLYNRNAEDVLISSDDIDWMPISGYDQYKKSVNINGGTFKVLSDSVMKNPLTGEWVFKMDPIKVYWCEERNRFLDEERAEKSGLELDKTRKKTLNMGEYLPTTYPDDIPTEEDLLDYLVDLKPTDEQMEQIRRIKSKSYPIRGFSDDEIWSAVKFGIFNMPKDKNRSQGFSLPYRYGEWGTTESKKRLLGSVSIASSQLDVILKRLSAPMVYDVIKDKRMLMTWSKMVNA